HITQVGRDTLRTDGLRYWQFKVLLTLRRQGPPYSASPSHLADALGLTRGALSARLGPLEQDGLITRAIDEADRRRVHVQPTPAGHAAFEQHVSSEGQNEGALLAALTRDESRLPPALPRKLVLAIDKGRPLWATRPPPPPGKFQAAAGGQARAASQDVGVELSAGGDHCAGRVSEGGSLVPVSPSAASSWDWLRNRLLARSAPCRLAVLGSAPVRSARPKPARRRSAPSRRAPLWVAPGRAGCARPAPGRAAPR